MTTKIKALKPSLREKKRYIAFKIRSENKVNFNAMSDAVYASYSRLFGEIGLAKAGIIVLKERWNADKQTGILRISHKYINELKSSLALIKEIDNTRVIASSITASGMLVKAAQRAFAA